MGQSCCGKHKNKEDRKIEDTQLNLKRLDKAFNSILKGYDKDKLQDWIDGKV